MFKNKFKGKFIAVEGLDGSGAATQAEEIASWLRKEKKPVWLTSEPTSNLIGAMIKSCLVGDYNLDSPAGLQLLFAADRATHLEKEIIPRLKEGITVITDRYLLSSIAYGSIETGDTDWLARINDQFLLPDLTILIKTSAKICIKRMKLESKNFSMFSSEDKLQKVWNVYEAIHKKYPNIRMFDGDKEEFQVFEAVKKEVEKLV
jgi:dTMP kinase